MFYDNYAYLCRKKGISPSMAAVAMDISKASVSYWKNKGGIPNTETLKKISAFFDVPVSRLLSDDMIPDAREVSPVSPFPQDIGEGDAIPAPGFDRGNVIEARIDTTAGSRNKYKSDLKTGRIKLDTALPPAVTCPAEHGIIEGALSESKRALCIFVLTSSPTFPGCFVDARVIGGMGLSSPEFSGEEHVMVSVCDADPMYDNIKKLSDIPERLLSEMRDFSLSCLTPSFKKAAFCRFFGGDEAASIISGAIERYKSERKGRAN